MTGDPERDRRLARQVRYGPRWPQSLSELAERWERSPEARNARRCAKATGILRERLPALATRVRLAGLAGGVLTLEAADHLALHELKTIHAHDLLTAFAQGGCAVHRLAFRLRRGGPPPASPASQPGRAP
jgi:hypothetical protein